MLGIIDGLTSSIESRTKFIPWREDDDIRPWAERNKSACARRVSVRFLGATEPPAVNDTLVQEVRDTAEIVICYPKGGPMRDSISVASISITSSRSWLPFRPNRPPFG